MNDTISRKLNHMFDSTANYYFGPETTHSMEEATTILNFHIASSMVTSTASVRYKLRWCLRIHETLMAQQWKRYHGRRIHR